MITKAGSPSLAEGSAPPAEQPSSLRERKKLATRRMLRRVALDLVAERGLANVTVEDIALAADVSPRTFFNYFASKEAALFGDSDPDRAGTFRDQVASEAPGEPALTALRTVMGRYAETIADEFRALGGDPADLLRRMKVARGDPQVRGAHAAQMAMLERAISEGLAARLGVSPDADPYPGVLAAAAVGVVRACTAFWAAAGGAIPLGQLIGQAFGALADGLPESSPLRRITVNTTDKKDSL
ncbi:MAG TPA: TetR/AcrR family transcriptional regulator [Trebonia sp.]|nr:TetR/AcrR family transcriptional regulator [Trebonia sp.]